MKKTIIEGQREIEFNVFTVSTAYTFINIYVKYEP